MAAVAWLAAVLASAAIGWLAAAFLLRWPESGRCLATVLTPVAMTGMLMFRWICGRGEPVVSNGAINHWLVAFAVISLVLASFACLPALPIWLLMERWLGARAGRG